jgi:hypothetical protein
VIVAFEAEVAIFGEQVLDVKVANKIGRTIATIAVTKVAVENETIVE